MLLRGGLGGIFGGMMVMKVVECEFLLAGHWVEYGKLEKKKIRFES